MINTRGGITVPEAWDFEDLQYEYDKVNNDK